MLASLIIVFREVLEAGLIVGIVLAATEGVSGRMAWVFGGIAGGLAGAITVAAFAGAISNALEGMGQEIFNASILMIAALMLAWHNIWMARHGSQMARDAKTLGQSVATGEKSLLALAIVVAVAVLREGSEVVLFLYGIAASNTDGPVAMLIGGIFGLLGGAAVSALLYRGLIAIPVRHFFTVTHWMIALLAAGMAGQAASILANNDFVPSLGNRIWDTSWLLPDSSLVGRALHALVGYADRPSGVQVAVWATTLLVLTLLARLVRGDRAASAQQRRPAARPLRKPGGPSVAG